MNYLKNHTDSELVSMLKNDNEDAYTEIFNRYNSLLFIHAFKKLQNREEAKDIVQEVFTIFWSKRATFVLDSNLAGFLYTCTYYRILDLIAHKKLETKFVNSLDEFIILDKKRSDHLIRENQLQEIINAEIAALPAKMRKVFELSRKNQLSHKEIAEHLSISEETVKSQIKNALKILRIKLGVFTFLFFLIKF